MKFSIKDFFSKCDQFRSFLWIWPYLPKKSLTENFIFCSVCFCLKFLFWECVLRDLKDKYMEKPSKHFHLVSKVLFFDMTSRRGTRSNQRWNNVKKQRWEILTILKVHCAIKKAIAKQIWRQINICILTVLMFDLYVWKRHRLTASKYHVNRKLLC